MRAITVRFSAREPTSRIRFATAGPAGRPAWRRASASIMSRNGLPPVSAWHASTSSAETALPSRSPRTVATPPAVSGAGLNTFARRSSSSSASTPAGRSPARTATARAMLRLAMLADSSASQRTVGASAHCTSSSISSSGPCSARSNVALAPAATASDEAASSGQSSPRSSRAAANATCPDSSEACAKRTMTPAAAARSAAKASSVDLPIPAGPSITRRPPRPASSWAMSTSIADSSRPRSTSASVDRGANGSGSSVERTCGVTRIGPSSAAMICASPSPASPAAISARNSVPRTLPARVPSQLQRLPLLHAVRKVTTPARRESIARVFEGSGARWVMPGFGVRCQTWITVCRGHSG